MPAAIEIDRDQVKMLALSVGCREAARKLGINEATVRQWSKRGKWFAHLTQPLPPPEKPLSMRPVTVVTTSPAAVLSNTLAELGNATRLAGAKAVRNALEHAAGLDGESALAASRNVKDAIGGAAQLHGWGAGDGGPTQINILGGQNVIQPQMRD